MNRTDSLVSLSNTHLCVTTDALFNGSNAGTDAVRRGTDSKQGPWTHTARVKPSSTPTGSVTSVSPLALCLSDRSG